MSRTPHTRTRLTALVATLACAAAGASAGPASAASPVSDQYLSAPVPLVQSKVTPKASTTSKATAPSAGPQAPAAAPTAAAGAGPTPAQAAVKPVTVTRTADAGKTVADRPLAAPTSDLPLLPLAALAVLAVGFALAAAGRARGRAATP